MEASVRVRVLALLLCFNTFLICSAQVLTPPTFNLAKGRKITASATCGIGVSEPELYCTLTGATGNELELTESEIIQVCMDHVPPFLFLFRTDYFGSFSF